MIWGFPGSDTNQNKKGQKRNHKRWKQCTNRLESVGLIVIIASSDYPESESVSSSSHTSFINLDPGTITVLSFFLSSFYLSSLFSPYVFVWPKVWIYQRGVLPLNLFWHQLWFDWMCILWIISELAVCVLEPPSVWCHPPACKTPLHRLVSCSLSKDQSLQHTYTRQKWSSILSQYEHFII